MKKLVLVVCTVLFSAIASASYVVKFPTNVPCSTVEAADLSCQAVKDALNACYLATGYTVSQYQWPACNTSVVQVGTVIQRYRVSDGQIANYTVQSVVPVCALGTHYDTSTQTCVDDVTIAVASCMPSIRTISPCPSGYAPTNAIPAGSGAPSPFTSDYDGLPIQDMIYAVGIAVCALLGVSVGVKLI